MSPSTYITSAFQRGSVLSWIIRPSNFIDSSFCVLSVHVTRARPVHTCTLNSPASFRASRSYLFYSVCCYSELPGSAGYCWQIPGIARFLSFSVGMIGYLRYINLQVIERELVTVELFVGVARMRKVIRKKNEEIICNCGSMEMKLWP